MIAVTNLSHEEAERVANEVFGERPTPEQIDEKARQYLEAKQKCAEVDAVLKGIEIECVALVKQWGVVPPNAEKSRRLAGRLAELTVTKSDAITVDGARVIDLRDALQSAGRHDFFKRLFAEQTKWEIVDGAESALKVESLPKRMAEKVLNMFGRCILIHAKKPSLKVTVADPSKPAKKSRAKKEAAK
jgi:hypothetical protein